MNIDFGVVKKYFSDRGFGFVSCTFRSSHQSEVFFHIKSVKKSRLDLAEKLDNEVSLDTIYFWYETKNTSKGEQVSNVLYSNAIHNMIIDNYFAFVEKIESVWSNIDSILPVWLHDVTVDLLGNDRANELRLTREKQEQERKELEEKKRKEWEARRKIEEEKLQKQIEEQKIQEEIEEKEFEQLLAEMKPLGLTKSQDVSQYIINNRLGQKYKNISGIVTMEQDGISWDFRGGFPSKIYARLCKELGLVNQNTRARVVGFKSFKDL